MNFLILQTTGGKFFARRVGKELMNLGHKYYRYYCYSIDKAFQNHPEWNPDNLIIHSRAANPTANWVKRLEYYENKGFKVVNSTEVLRLTSDKLKSNMELKFEGNIPNTWSINTNNLAQKELDVIKIFSDEFVIKPRYSQGNGCNVHTIKGDDLTVKNIKELTDGVSNYWVIQEYIKNIKCLFRVFVIGKKALPYVTYDTPILANDWKLSVCLNKKQKPLHDVNVNQGLLSFAERIQQAINGDINFIDVFETRDGYVLSEVNTACNLKYHEEILGENIAKEIAKYLVGNV